MHQIPALKGAKRHAGTPLSDAFPPLGAHVSDAEFQHPDTLGRRYVAFGQHRSRFGGVTRDNCHYSWRPSAAIHPFLLGGASGPRVTGRGIKKRINARRWACVDFLYDRFFCPDHLSLG